MPARTATARWDGGLREGKGSVRLGSGAFEGQYSFGSRFEEGVGTNPEELIGAAHAGCFSMAFALALGKAGFSPQRVDTSANVHLEKGESGSFIARIDLDTQAEVGGGIDEATFQEIAQKTKETCPVSKALAAVPEITVTAKLI
jgi:osmotically inducible protein OsmC